MLLFLLEEERDCELNDVNCVCMLKTCASNLCHFCRKDPHHSGEDVVANLRRWNRNSVDVEGVIKEMQARLILVQKHTLNHFLGNKNLLSESSILYSTLHSIVHFEVGVVPIKVVTLAVDLVVRDNTDV